MTSSTDAELVARLTAKDLSLWPADSVAPTRLGWLDSPAHMVAIGDRLTAWANDIAASRVVLLGMGGSSLGPIVLSGRDGRASELGGGARSLVVLDTTEPSAVAGLDLDDAVIIVSSKSGTTLETELLFEYCWNIVDDPDRYIVITDRNSPLVGLAKSRGITTVFENDPTIGGRFSVLSYFGMVPAALLGIDVAGFARAALDCDLEAACALGVDLAARVQRGEYLVAAVSTPAVPRFALWAEQLLAESTGKGGTGCIPVPVAVPTGSPAGLDGRFALDDADDLARAFFGCEIAVAICGGELGIDPFDEPDVAEAKRRTLQVLDGAAVRPSDVEVIEGQDVSKWLRQHRGDAVYCALLAYLPPDEEGLDAVRARLAAHVDDLAITGGFGPRYLHSTGQLHKGGPAGMLAIQIISDDLAAVGIPDRRFDFAELLRAQADGDLLALRARGRTVVRVHAANLDEIG